MINYILHPWLNRGVAVYLDDIIVYSGNMLEHVQLMELILDRLADHKLFVIRPKCKFGVPTMEFLGRIISLKGVQPDPSKVESKKLGPVPISIHNVLVFLGMTGYYSRFVPEYIDKATALTDLLKKSTKWEWSTTALKSFEQLKLMLSTAPIL